jgi:serine/threonine-protein kinase ULK/ATG1
MADLKHRNVCKLISATKTESNYYLVTEFCNGGDLSGFMKSRGGYLKEPEARLLLKQMVRGLAAI